MHTTAVKRSRSLKCSNVKSDDDCVRAMRSDESRKICGKESIDLFRSSPIAPLHYGNQITREKRILIAQSFFSWMNIDSHSKIHRKKCPVNRLTMKISFLSLVFFDPKPRGWKSRSPRNGLSFSRLRSRQMKRTRIKFTQMWMNSKLLVIIELWILPKKKSIPHQKLVRLMRKSSREDETSRKIFPAQQVVFHLLFASSTFFFHFFRFRLLSVVLGEVDCCKLLE